SVVLANACQLPVLSPGCDGHTVCCLAGSGKISLPPPTLSECRDRGLACLPPSHTSARSESSNATPAWNREAETDWGDRRRLKAGMVREGPEGPVSTRTNAHLISRLRLHTNDRDCARPLWQVR